MRAQIRKVQREAKANIERQYQEMVAARKLDKIENVITQEVFNNVEEAAKVFNMKANKIQKALDGKRKYAGRNPENGERYEWRYAEDDAMVWWNEFKVV